jgi:bis(5'-nucleosidyl)-tetraphosphatase
MKHEHSYGIIPIQKIENEWRLLLVQHASAHYWGLPKGHAEKGETPQQTAVRELKEETNLIVSSFISDSPLEEKYFFRWNGEMISKTVWYYIALVEGTIQLQFEEVSASKWVPLASAAEFITYEADRSVCQEALKIIAEFL